MSMHLIIAISAVSGSSGHLISSVVFRKYSHCYFYQSYKSTLLKQLKTYETLQAIAWPYEPQFCRTSPDNSHTYTNEHHWWVPVYLPIHLLQILQIKTVLLMHHPTSMRRTSNELSHWFNKVSTTSTTTLMMHAQWWVARMKYVTAYIATMCLPRDYDLKRNLVMDSGIT